MYTREKTEPKIHSILCTERSDRDIFLFAPQKSLPAQIPRYFRNSPGNSSVNDALLNVRTDRGRFRRNLYLADLRSRSYTVRVWHFSALYAKGSKAFPSPDQSEAQARTQNVLASH